MESCERIKSNTLRVNFDTMQRNKQERIFCVDSTLCQVCNHGKLNASSINVHRKALKLYYISLGARKEAA